jgi:hypothetical protein
MSKLIITVEIPDGASVAVSTEDSAAPAKAKGGKKAAAVTESAQPVASQPQVATAPAPQPAQSPAAPTISKETLNKAVTKLAGINRDAAIALLAKFGTRTTATLDPAQYQAVFDAFEEEQAKFDAAAAQASLV